jgi:hypothetical protein
VGSSGRVIAEDIDTQALQAVRERCAPGHVSNVSVLVGEEVVKTLDFLPTQTIWICKRQVRD